MEKVKIDKRKHYVLMFDTETANGLDYPLVYDFGCAVIDTKGNIYETRSFINKDIFCGCKDLMESAYYKEKIPQYWTDIWTKQRELLSYLDIKREVRKLMEKYGITEVIAHNVRFDYKSANTTLRYETCSKMRFFFPYGTKYLDTMLMAQDVICNTPTYKRFCAENGYLCKNGAVRKTAEILYRYITKDNTFVEEHRGIEDVLIEKEIYLYCLKKHKKMRKEIW